MIKSFPKPVNLSLFPEFKPTQQQLDIVRESITGNSFEIVALAGCSKTTTAKMICEALHKFRSVFVCSFTKKIVDDIERKIKMPNVKVSTLHSAGRTVIIDSGVVLLPYKNRKGENCRDKVFDTCVRMRLQDAYSYKVLIEALRIRRIDGNDISPDNCMKLAAERQIKFKSQNWVMIAFNCQTVIKKTRELAREGYIDYTDMLELAVDILDEGYRAGFDTVIIDESQDCNPLQIAFLKALRASQYIPTYDPNQRIFGFAGAVSDFGKYSRNTFGITKTLSLTASFRCSVSVAVQAAKIVPDFVPYKDNPVGNFEYIERLEDTPKLPNMVLARTNKLCVQNFVDMVRRGIKCKLSKFDVMKYIEEVFRFCVERNKTPDDWAQYALDDMYSQGLEKNLENWIRRDIAERLEMTQFIFKEFNGYDFQDTYNNAKQFFKDSRKGGKNAIECITIHSAKGLEGEVVVVADSEWKDEQDELECLVYVAITRAKNTCYIVRHEDDDGCVGAIEELLT
ncbi:AAA family ATPase [Pseudomonadales bacterium]|nr:AAA family ATPase [Pseudomonadales bacterium]